MNRNLALTESGGSWPVDHLAHGAAVPAGERQRPGPTLDFATAIRILKEWRWLVLGATALGLLLAVVYTLLTTPLYRSWVTLEANPPTVEIMDEQSDRAMAPNIWDFVAT